MGIDVPADGWFVQTDSSPATERKVALALAAFGLLFGPLAYRMRRRAYGEEPPATRLETGRTSRG